ncbi:hypothetical protein [Streptomyces phaeochromogenes]
MRAELRAADEEMRPCSPLPNDPRSDEVLITDSAADLTSFRVRNAPARTVAVNAPHRAAARTRRRTTAAQLPPRGLRPASDDESPLALVSTPRAVPGRVAATEVKSLLLRLAGLARDGSRHASAAPRQRK